jgi:hypothetical protein
MASNTEPESSDSINLSTTNEDESTIGAKLVKKLEALSISSHKIFLFLKSLLFSQ